MGLRGPKRTKVQKKFDRSRVVELYLKGKEQTEIAEVLGLTQQQISYDLKKIQAEWLQNTTINLDAHKVEEVAKTRQLEKKYWDIYDKSCNDFKSQTVTGKVLAQDESVKPVSQMIHTETRNGDTKPLDGVLKCIERRCKLLGLDAPERVEGEIIITSCKPARGIDEENL